MNYKIEKAIDISKEIVILLVTILVIGLLFYSFLNYRLYTVGGLVAFGLVIWALDLLRVLSFNLNRVYNKINKRFWNWMILLNQFLNWQPIIYLLYFITFISLVRFIYVILKFVTQINKLKFLYIKYITNKTTTDINTIP